MTEDLSRYKRPGPVIFGQAPPGENQQVAEQLKRDILDAFGEGHNIHIPDEILEQLATQEREKKPYEKLAIQEANKITNGLLTQFGFHPFDIPERNIHIIPESLYRKIDKRGKGTTAHNLQAIFINRSLANPIEEISIILHEITHLKNHLAIEYRKEEEGPITASVYRTGLAVSSFIKEPDFTMFTGLNEAVVSEIEKRYLWQIVEQIAQNDKYLKRELEWQSSPEA